MPYQNLLAIAQDAAKQAGAAVLDIYDSGDFTEYSKDDDSPVTSADYKANEIITQLLEEQTPDIPIMSEESEHLCLTDRKNWSRYWLIDPIDGTQEFIARSGDFAVNIALIENNQPVIGVIYWPAGESLYYATKGAGAYKSCAIEEKQIHVKAFNDPDNDPVVIAISRRQKRENERYRRIVSIGTIRRPVSGTGTACVPNTVFVERTALVVGTGLKVQGITRITAGVVFYIDFAERIHIINTNSPEENTIP